MSKNKVFLRKCKNCYNEVILNNKNEIISNDCKYCNKEEKVKNLILIKGESKYILCRKCNSLVKTKKKSTAFKTTCEECKNKEKIKKEKRLKHVPCKKCGKIIEVEKFTPFKVCKECQFKEDVNTYENSDFSMKCQYCDNIVNVKNQFVVKITCEECKYKEKKYVGRKIENGKYIRYCVTCKKPIIVENYKKTFINCDECKKKVDDSYKNETRNYDTSDLIYCRICFKVRKRLDNHIKKEHKITIEQYLQQFPKASIFCDNFLNRRHSTEAKILIGKNTRSGYTRGIRKDLGFYVRSKEEANFCRLLNFFKINYIYEIPFKLEYENNEEKIYFVDFYLFDDFEMFKKDSYLELKGFFNDNAKKKVSLFIKQYSNLNFQVIKYSSKTWQYIENKYKDKIPLWETVKTNLNTRPDIYKLDENKNKKDYVVCPLCIKNGLNENDAKQRFLTYNHIKTVHNYTLKDFKKEFLYFKMKP